EEDGGGGRCGPGRSGRSVRLPGSVCPPPLVVGVLGALHPVPPVPGPDRTGRVGGRSSLRTNPVSGGGVRRRSARPPRGSRPRGSSTPVRSGRDEPRGVRAAIAGSGRRVRTTHADGTAHPDGTFDPGRAAHPDGTFDPGRTAHPRGRIGGPGHVAPAFRCPRPFRT